MKPSTGEASAGSRAACRRARRTLEDLLIGGPRVAAPTPGRLAACGRREQRLHRLVRGERQAGGHEPHRHAGEGDQPPRLALEVVDREDRGEQRDGVQPTEDRDGTPDRLVLDEPLQHQARLRHPDHTQHENGEQHRLPAHVPLRQAREPAGRDAARGPDVTDLGGHDERPRWIRMLAIIDWRSSDTEANVVDGAVALTTASPASDFTTAIAPVVPAAANGST